MRFAFAVSNLRLPADLAATYDDVTVAGAFAAWSDLVTAVTTAHADEPVEVAVLDRDLVASRDRVAGLDLAGALAAIRTAAPKIRLVVVARGELDASLLSAHEALGFLDLDPVLSARNLGKLLGLVDQSAVAKVIMVSGYQGGTGKTTMSRFVAAELAARYPASAGKRSPVLFWELDLAHPTLAFDREVDLLGTEGGRRTISRILNAGPIKIPDDQPKLDASVVSAASSGAKYDVLLAPHGAREVMAVMQAYNDDLVALRDRLRAILELAKRTYRYIVIDTGTDYISHPGAQVALESADAICLMSTPTAAGLSALASLEVIIGDRGLFDRTRVFLNRGKGDDSPYLKACIDVASRVGKGGALGLIMEVQPSGLEEMFRPRAAQFLAEFGL
jgi:MinD-like ATPase involved in chromosome partitioning or flagellar assembly